MSERAESMPAITACSPIVRRWRAWLPPPPPRAPAGSTRALTVAASSSQAESERPARPSRQRLAWAELLARVVLINVLRCPHCEGRRRILSFITEPRTIGRILAHLGLPTDPPPVAPAIVPLAPDGQWCLDLAPADDEPANDTEPDTDPCGDADPRAPP